MKICFYNDQMSVGDQSPHNVLAVLSASYSHSIRFAEPGVYSKIIAPAYGNKITDIPSEYKCLRKICLIYDGYSYNVSKYHDVIRFGDTCDTYPVDYNFHKVNRLNQVVSFGNIHTKEQYEKYVTTLIDLASNNKIIVANKGEFAPVLKTKLSEERICYDEPENDSIVLLDAYLRTSSTLVHYGDGFFGHLHAKASLYALNDNAKYITDTEIRRPTNILDFIKRIGG